VTVQRYFLHFRTQTDYASDVVAVEHAMESC